MNTSERLGYEATAEQSLVIANRIAEICQGEKTACVFIALSMMIGHMSAQAEVPDFDGTVALVTEGARDNFRKERERLEASRLSKQEGAP